MTKTDKYYPCTNCFIKKKYSQFVKCPFEKRSMCLTYKACEAMSELAKCKDEDYFNSIPPELIVDVLRSHGYTGAIRKTEIVNI